MSELAVLEAASITLRQHRIIGYRDDCHAQCALRQVLSELCGRTHPKRTAVMAS